MKQLIRLSVIFFPFLFGATACMSPQQRWKELTEEVRRTAAEPKTPEERCQRRGGVLHGGQCYTPGSGSATASADTCRLHGGLYLDEKCFLAPQPQKQ